MIRAIGFDLWETLITDTPELSRQQERLRLDRIEEALSAHGFETASARIEHAYRSLWHRCHELYWSADVDISCRRQIEHFLEALDLDPATFSEDALAALEHAYAHAAVEVLPAAVEGAGDALARLRSRGYKIGIISNTGRTPGYALRDILAGLGLAEFIDAMVFSNEHGACKPQRSIFEELRVRLGVAFDEIVFVGDNIYVDVHGAQSCGMRGIHFQPPKRGTAIAPPFDHGLEIVADGEAAFLIDVVRVIESIES